ncbi:MAG: hypothetical protein AAF735_07980 [Myxococcota bacterium]
MANDVHPEIGAAAVERIARREFGGEADTALSILARYGCESWHRELSRVRTAAMYIASGDLHELEDVIAAACRDYRDVLMWAEYRDYDRGPTAHARHARVYLEWLNRD